MVMIPDEVIREMPTLFGFRGAEGKIRTKRFWVVVCANDDVVCWFAYECEACGAYMQQQVGRGPKPKYCSAACRSQAFRDRRRELAIKRHGVLQDTKRI
jgi:hypothetical protein